MPCVNGSPVGGKVIAPGSYVRVDGGGDVRGPHASAPGLTIGLGDLAAVLLRLCFVTEARWLWVKSWFVEQPSCGCQRRRAHWNRFRILRPLKWVGRRLRHLLRDQPSSTELTSPRRSFDHDCSSVGKRVRLVSDPGEDLMRCPLCQSMVDEKYQSNWESSRGAKTRIASR